MDHDDLPPPPPGAEPIPAPPPLPGDVPPPPPGRSAVTPGGTVATEASHESAGAAEALLQRALLHATEQTRTYPCAQCGAQLEFDPSIQQLKCPSCGNVQPIIENDGGEVVEQDFREALAALEAGVLGKASVQIEGEKEVVCQSCGGHTTFTGSLTATRCPYCATPIQRDDVHAAPARLPVDGVLPFHVDAKTAKAAIEKWIESRWFAPNEFKKYATAGSFNSVYCAYFTYDAHTTTRYTGMRGDTYTVTVGSGENQRTETRVRWTPRAGTVHNAFDDLPILANEGLERRHVEKLEPWPTHQAQPFSAEFVAGHLCRTYDHDVAECFPQAKSRMEDEIRETVRRDIGGDQQRITSMGVHYHDISYKHLLLPVWLLTVMYLQKPFQVFINGVTGEVQGQRPYSKIKIALAVVAALVLAGIAYAVFGQGSSSSGTTP